MDLTNTKKKRTRRVRVCPLCQTCYWHSIIYCFKCPGKLEIKDLPWPDSEPLSYFSGPGAGKRLAEWVEANGAKYDENVP